jgi:hypothetical protein
MRINRGAAHQQNVPGVAADNTPWWRLQVHRSVHMWEDGNMVMTTSTSLPRTFGSGSRNARSPDQ